nr:S24 family peptidase [Pseudomonas syringae]
MFSILRITGLRRGELLNLKVEDIDFAKNTQRVVRRPDSKGDARKPSSGSIVIAAVNNELRCKILIFQGDHVVLKSANPAYPPRHILEGEELSIYYLYGAL